MMVQIIAGLASVALIAAGLAMIFAGRSILIAARFVIGWFALFVAIAFATAAGAIAALNYLASHMAVGARPTTAVLGVLALGAISVAGVRAIAPRGALSKSRVARSRSMPRPAPAPAEPLRPLSADHCARPSMGAVRVRTSVSCQGGSPVQPSAISRRGRGKPIRAHARPNRAKLRPNTAIRRRRTKRFATIHRQRPKRFGR
jgi:hypothetical protein